MTYRHNVFISYHHKNDEAYKIYFEQMFHTVYDILETKAVSDGDINPGNSTEYTRQLIRDNYIKDATVTVVLIGSETWKRKHVDWEVSSSLRDTQLNSRTGLVGIILPTYPRNDLTKYDPHTVPPRLYDNINNGFATIYNWSDDPGSVQAWIHDAFLKRKTALPDNNRPMFSQNRSGVRWQ
jgi:hypothetical protein